MRSIDLHTYEIPTTPERIRTIFEKVLNDTGYPIPKVADGNFMTIYLQHYTIGTIVRPYFSLNITESAVEYSRLESFALFTTAKTVGEVRKVLEGLFTIIKNVPAEFSFIRIHITPTQINISYRDKSTQAF